LLWHDLNLNELQDAGEPGLSARIVYLDQNQNGALDESEVSTTTGDDGSFSFGDVAPGQYAVATDLPAGWLQACPVLRYGIVKSITREPSRGVTVDYNGEDIDIEVHIIVEYGTRITSVADSVKNTIRFNVEKALGLKVNSISVHVAGLRISDTD
jgi:hypothetical protein